MLTISKLTSFFPQSGGRNHHGVITVWHRGGGNKKLYRLIDFKRILFHIPALVLSIHSDPFRTSHIALICYKTGLLSYILAPTLLFHGSLIQSGPSSSFSVGNSLPLFSLPLGSFVHNIEFKPGKGAQFLRSAGTFAKLVRKDLLSAFLRLPSGKFFRISLQCMATLGVVSSPSLSSSRKAGHSRWLNIRPTVRGVAMNPVDHPHGGGEGRSKGGRHPVSPWGKLTKGKPTSRSRSSLFFT